MNVHERNMTESCFRKWYQSYFEKRKECWSLLRNSKVSNALSVKMWFTCIFIILRIFLKWGEIWILQFLTALYPDYALPPCALQLMNELADFNKAFYITVVTLKTTLTLFPFNSQHFLYRHGRQIFRWGRYCL
jgi:hypothetical protein